MEHLNSIDPLTGLILLAAAIICILVLFVKTITVTLKLCVIAVMLLTAGYFLMQAGLLPIH